MRLCVFSPKANLCSRFAMLGAAGLCRVQLMTFLTGGEIPIKYTEFTVNPVELYAVTPALRP